MRRSLLAACALAIACAAPPPRAARAPQRTPFGAVAGRPDGTRWLGADAARAKLAGASDSVVLTVESGAAGDRVNALLAVPEHDCVLLIARGSATIEDLDLFAYGDDGTVLGSDEAPDKTPSMLVCPPHPPHLYIAARVAAGHGLVAIGAQRVSQANAARVGRAVGTRGLPGASDENIEMWPALEERLAEHRRRIGARWEDVRRVAVPLDPRQATRVSALVEDNRCLDFLVLPDDEVSHLDVSVLDERGREAGRAAGAGRDRSLIVCSPTRAPVTLEIRPHVGRGLAAVVISRTLAGAARDVEAEALRFDLTPTDDLDVARAKFAARMETLGYARGKSLAEGALVVGQRHSVDVELPAGCARIDLIGAAPMQGVEAWLWSAQGDLIAHDRRGGSATLFACSPGGPARVDAEALLRAGRYALEIRPEPDTAALLTQHPLAAGRLLGKMTDRGVIKRPDQVGAPELLSLDSARLERREILVPVDRCVDMTVAFGPGARGAELRLVDVTTDEELDRAEGSDTASARACAFERGRTLHVRAEIRTGVGSTEALSATRMLAPRP